MEALTKLTDLHVILDVIIKHPKGCLRLCFRPSDHKYRNKIFCKVFIWPKVHALLWPKAPRHTRAQMATKILVITNEQTYHIVSSVNPKNLSFVIFLASQDALEVMRVTH